MPPISSVLTQAFPPKPKFTEKELPSLREKVYIVTGSNTGVGKELAQILYSKDAKVYVAARSQEKAFSAIESIKAAIPTSSGSLTYLHLDLADLSTIKPSVQDFLSKETKLHVLFNNAGVMNPPKGSTSEQGHELCLGVNNIGTYFFTKLLTPLLTATAMTEPPSTVRVIWVASSAAEGVSPKGGIPFDNLDYHEDKGWLYKYGVSKAGNYLHATEFAKRHREDGIVSVALNPGNLNSDLYRTQPMLVAGFLRLFLHDSIYGAYTELFAGLSPDVTIEKSGDWIVPWGRFMAIRKDLVDASKSEDEGGTGGAKKFWEWTDEQVKSYL